jgi:hypothetical protein
MCGFECSWANTGTKRSLATKVITRHPDGSVTEQPYGKAKYFGFAKRAYPTLEAFATALRSAALAKTVFLIRGQLREGLFPKAANARIWKEGNPKRTLDGPDRSWGVFDLDGALVPEGLSFRQQLLFVRDEALPAEFNNVRMVATATSSTRRKEGLRARLYFLLVAPLSNAVLERYTETLPPSLHFDGRVFEAGQPIYTARPVFYGLLNPVPQSEWVLILDGDRDRVELNPAALPPAPARSAYTAASVPAIPLNWFAPEPTPDDGSDPFLTAVKAHAGAGVLIEITEFGRKVLEEAYERIVEAKPTQRHYTINRESFNVGQRHAEGHIPFRFSTGKRIGDVLLAATAEMKHNDRYSEVELRRKIVDGLNEGVRCPRESWGRDDD